MKINCLLLLLIHAQQGVVDGGGYQRGQNSGAGRNGRYSPTTPRMTNTKANVELWSENGTVTGFVSFRQDSDMAPVSVSGIIHGLTEGKHGFHIHSLGNLTGGCKSTGGHYNPTGAEHASPNATNRHVGDLGNIIADSTGIALVDLKDSWIKLDGPLSIVGRAVVVHAGVDDLGLGGNDDSLKTGNAGGRVACGVVGIAQETEVPMWI